MRAVASAALGHTYPKADLTSAWQSLLFNQFHDILAGTSLPEGYVDARDWFGHAATLAGRALNTSIQAIGSRVDTRGPGDALLVFNPLPWEVTVPVEVERGSASLTDAGGEPVAAQAVQPTTVVGQRRSCFVAKLPALGYRLFRQDVAATSDNPLFKTTDEDDGRRMDHRRRTMDDRRPTAAFLLSSVVHRLWSWRTPSGASRSTRPRAG